MNYKTVWKQLANSKQNSATNHYEYCLIKAVCAKSNNKREIAQALLRRAFTPSKTNGWKTVDKLGYWRVNRTHVLGKPITEVLTQEQAEAYWELVKDLSKEQISKSENDYLFIFVRQDISNERQAVQACHAVYKAGRYFESNPDETYFVLIGVEDECQLQEVEALLQKHECSYVWFNEPDLANTLTAIATAPMKEHQKRFLKKYKRLQF